MLPQSERHARGADGGVAGGAGLGDAALRGWLLDHCEARDLWYEPDECQAQPRAMTVNRLADRLRGDRDVVAVARLYADDPDAGLAQVIADIIEAEHVPYLAQFRYKPSAWLNAASGRKWCTASARLCGLGC